MIELTLHGGHASRRANAAATQSSADDLDDRLLRITVWTNQMLRGDGGGGHDFAEVYEHVYAVTHHGGHGATDQKLYGRLCACVAHHLNDTVAPALERAAGCVELLAVARRAWTDYERAAGRLADAYVYLDAVMARRGRGAAPVRAMASATFRDMLLRTMVRNDNKKTTVLRNETTNSVDDLLGRLEDAVVRAADVHLWKGIANADAAFCGRTVLAAVANGCDRVAARLSDRFVAEADRRLRAFATRTAVVAADGGFAEHAGRAIDAESAVALHYGGPAVARAVVAHASTVLVSDPANFVSHWTAVLGRMMLAGRPPQSVAQVYELLARLPDVAGPQMVADAVDHCAERRLGTVPMVHPVFVTRVLEFRDTMDEYLRQAYGDDPVVAHAVDYHVRYALNRFEAARLMARYVGELIAGPKPVDPRLLHAAFDLVVYMDDGAQDEFDIYYRYQLMLRLSLHSGQQQANDGLEEVAYGMFVARCGRPRARKLRLLLDDVWTSVALASRPPPGGHKGREDGHHGWSPLVNVLAIHEKVCPLPVRPTHCLYSGPMYVAFRRFRELYVSAHGGMRELTLMPQLCTAEVSATRRGQPVRFTATMFQVTVLLAFNKIVETSRQWLADRTNIPEPELDETLKALIGNGVLSAATGPNRFRLNPDYESTSVHHDR